MEHLGGVFRRQAGSAGFTLVELAATLVVIAVISMMGLSSYAMLIGNAQEGEMERWENVFFGELAYLHEQNPTYFLVSQHLRDVTYVTNEQHSGSSGTAMQTVETVMLQEREPVSLKVVNSAYGYEKCFVVRTHESAFNAAETSCEPAVTGDSTGRVIVNYDR